MANGWVVVTGASTGIGEATARRLAGAGFRVLAGVRKDEDAARLEGEGIEPVRLDVTSADDVGALAERVSALDGLAALVNNAGIAVAGPVEVLPVERWREQFEVNVIGQVAVTKALIPALIRARGRIVNMSSVSGRVSAPLVGPYAGSKFAMEAITDALRGELRDAGVEVVAVEPGQVATPIWGKGRAGADELLSGADPAALARYEPAVRALLALSELGDRSRTSADDVARVVEKAITSRRPRTRYVVGVDARGQMALSTVLPDRAYDALVATLFGRLGKG